MDAIQAELKDTQARFYFALTLLVVLIAYAGFDKLVLDPRAVSESLKVQKEDFDDEFLEMKTDFKTRLMTLEDRVGTEEAQKLSTLNTKLGKTERELSRTKRDLDAIKNDILDQQALAKNAKAKLAIANTQESKARAEAQKHRLKVGELDQEREILSIQYKGLLDQRSVLFDSICKLLVDLRKKAPKGVPQTYKDKINRIIRRIRDAEKIDLTGKKQ
jgi:uncharacterized coiled-coil protein SlyX